MWQSAEDGEEGIDEDEKGVRTFRLQQPAQPTSLLAVWLDADILQIDANTLGLKVCCVVLDNLKLTINFQS